MLRRAGMLAAAVTPAGRGVLLLALIGGVLGRWLHWVEATTLAVACLVGFGLAVAQVWRPRPVEVNLRLRPATTVAGRAAEAMVAVTAHRLPLVTPVVSVPLATARTTVRLPTVRPRLTHVEVFEIPARRRGVYPVGPVSHVASDLLGLLRREIRWAWATELLVHPRTVQLGALSTGVVGDLEGAPSEQL